MLLDEEGLSIILHIIRYECGLICKYGFDTIIMSHHILYLNEPEEYEVNIK